MSGQEIRYCAHGPYGAPRPCIHFGEPLHQNIIDDLSSYCWSIPLGAKLEAFPALQAWELACEAETVMIASFPLCYLLFSSGSHEHHFHLTSNHSVGMPST